MPFCSPFSPGLAVVLFFDSCCKMMFCHEFTYCRVSSTITLSVCLQKKKKNRCAIMHSETELQDLQGKCIRDKNFITDILKKKIRTL